MSVTEIPAYSVRSQELERTRERDAEFLAMETGERLAAFQEKLADDAHEQRTYGVHLDPPIIRAFLRLVGGAARADLSRFDQVAVELGGDRLVLALEKLADDREKALHKRQAERDAKDAALAEGTRHPFYVDHNGLYVSHLADAGIAVLEEEDKGGGQHLDYARAYAEYVSGGRKSKPSPGQYGLGTGRALYGRTDSGGNRQVVARVRDAIDERARLLVEHVIVTPGQVASVLNDASSYDHTVSRERVYEALTPEEIVERTPTILPEHLEIVARYCEEMADGVVPVHHSTRLGIERAEGGRYRFVQRR